MTTKSKAYRLGFEMGFDHALQHWAAIERYNAKPPSQKPAYPSGSADDLAYEEGWVAGIAEAKRWDKPTPWC